MGKLEASQACHISYVSLLSWPLYYIVIIPEPTKKSLQTKIPIHESNRFEQFRLNGYILEKTAGAICQNLHLFMTAKNESVEISILEWGLCKFLKGFFAPESRQRNLNSCLGDSDIPCVYYPLIRLRKILDINSIGSRFATCSFVSSVSYNNLIDLKATLLLMKGTSIFLNSEQFEWSFTRQFSLHSFRNQPNHFNQRQWTSTENSQLFGSIVSIFQLASRLIKNIVVAASFGENKTNLPLNVNVKNRLQ